MDLNKNQLTQTAEERYKQTILSLIGAAMDRYPLPEHLEYMVSVKNRLSATPTVMFSIVRKAPNVTSDDVLSYIEATLPMQMDLPEGVRWLEDQVRDKGLDLRSALKAEDLVPPSICPVCGKRPVQIEAGHSYGVCLPCFTSNA